MWNQNMKCECVYFYWLIDNTNNTHTNNSIISFFEREYRMRRCNPCRGKKEKKKETEKKELEIKKKTKNRNGGEHK